MKMPTRKAKTAAAPIARCRGRTSQRDGNDKAEDGDDPDIHKGPSRWSGSINRGTIRDTLPDPEAPAKGKGAVEAKEPVGPSKTDVLTSEVLSYLELIQNGNSAITGLLEPFT